ncbi:MAG TPA: HAD-IB family hydrolase [Acidimicrobiales bacterium]|jgi:phosphatidylglycerophosphatase C|nr:HAD-IB family hydrolase [Acidimicrobiales bacterium]
MPDIAAFDFDGTLTTGGSVFDFLSAVTDRRKVANASVSLLPQLAHAALAGGEVADRTKERLFELVLGGTETSHFEAISVAFAERHLTGHLRPDVHRRWRWHQQRGDHTVIVSASPEGYIAEAGRLLGADHAIATRLATEEGHLTGRYDGKNCRGAEKLRRLREWTGRLEEPTGRLWVYGNSRGDLRMMEAADVGVNVGRLGSLGRLRHFPGLAASEPAT